MTRVLFENGRSRNAVTYRAYRDKFKKKAEASSPEELPEDERDYFEYYRLNFERSKRVEETYEPSDRLRQVVESLDDSQTWVVLTEPWCGDSAQILPILARAAALNEQIMFRILYRDDNLDIMDEYLTDGKRGIPKLIVFDSNQQEQFTWGPRPREAQQIFDEGEAAGRERTEIYREMQEWYNDDGGAAVDAELADAIEQGQTNSDSNNEQGPVTMEEEKSQEQREREEYERRVEEQIEQWEQKIEDLRKQVEGLQDNLKKEVDRESKRYKKEIDSLKVKRDAAKRLLSELTEASGKAWSGFQKELGNALEGAGEGLQRLADRLREARKD